MTEDKVEEIDRAGFEYWDEFNKIQRYSFLLFGDSCKDTGSADTHHVRCVKDQCGNWIEHYAASKLIDDMQGKINELTKLLNLEIARNKDDAMRIIVTGHKNHGKDFICELLRDTYGISFTSSSMAMLEEVIFPVLSNKYNYTTPEECFNDRDNHREEWYNLICKYNKDDGARLGKYIFTTSNIYCGLRNRLELNAMREQGIVDLVIWIDASKRKPLESPRSMTICKEDADYIFDNNGSKEDAIKALPELKSFILNHYIK